MMFSFLVAICLTLIAPANGKSNCSLGGDGKVNPRDTCTFTCDDGYELSGSASRVCTNGETWSGTTNRCTKGTYVRISFTYLLMHYPSNLYSS